MIFKVRLFGFEPVIEALDRLTQALSSMEAARIARENLMTAGARRSHLAAPKRDAHLHAMAEQVAELIHEDRWGGLTTKPIGTPKPRRTRVKR